MNRYHSPCIGVCELNFEGICIGCGRTRDEILDWVEKPGDERRRILVRCRERLERLDAGAGRSRIGGRGSLD